MYVWIGILNVSNGGRAIFKVNTAFCWIDSHTAAGVDWLKEVRQFSLDKYQV